jgi:hypothetical protein
VKIVFSTLKRWDNKPAGVEDAEQVWFRLHLNDDSQIRIIMPLKHKVHCSCSGMM